MRNATLEMLLDETKKTFGKKNDNSIWEFFLQHNKVIVTLQSVAFDYFLKCLLVLQGKSIFYIFF